MFRVTPLRTVLRTPAPRRISTQPYQTYSNAGPSASAPENEFVKERLAVKHHAGKSGELWRKITFYMAMPAILVGYLNAKSMMTEHEAHVKHMIEENGGEAPERVVYSYFNMRNKEFPWGPHTLFYNPHVNIDPEAAEE